VDALDAGRSGGVRLPAGQVVVVVAEYAVWFMHLMAFRHGKEAGKV
jgi:hypothetical protein